VRNRGNSGVTDLDRDGSKSADSLHELGSEDIISDVEDIGIVDVSVLKDERDLETVKEGLDAELVQESDVRKRDLLVDLDEVNSVQDFDRTLKNLGGDVKSLEKGGLSRVKTGGTRGYEHITGGDGTSSGGGRDLVVEDDLSDLSEVVVGENETDVSDDDGEESLEVGELLDVVTDDSSDDGVLSHQHDGTAAKGDTDKLHLVGTDIVNLDNEKVGIFLKNNQ